MKDKLFRLAVKFKPELIAFSVALFIQSAVLVIMLVSSGKGFSGVDCGVQYMPFFCELYHKLTGGGSIFYSWSGASGFDFWAVFGYYLASPLNIFAVFFNEKTMIYFVNILIIVKTSLCSVSFIYYVKRKYPSKKTFDYVLFGVIYAMCGYMIAYGMNVMWFDSIFMFPLILLQLEKLMNEKKCSGYILFLALSIIFNYYCGFMICVAIFFYWFTLRFSGVRDFLTKTLRLGLSSAVAGGMSLFILYPALCVYGQPGSITSVGQMGISGSFFTTLKTLLFLEEPVSMTSENGAANLYITVFALVLFFTFFLSGEFKTGDKVRAGVITVFLLLSMNIGALNYLWHGFRFQFNIPNRFSFILSFFMLVLAWRVFIRRGQISGFPILCSAGITAVLSAVIAAGSGAGVLAGAVNVILAVFYALLLCIRKLPRQRAVAVTVLPIIGVTAMLGISLKERKQNYVTALTHYTRDTLEAAKSMDDSFARSRLSINNSAAVGNGENAEFMNKLSSGLTEYNESLVAGLDSLSLFSSFHNANYAMLINSTGGGTGMTPDASYESVLQDMLFSVKYVFNRSVESCSAVYKPVTQCGTTQMLQNIYTLSPGFVVPETFVSDSLNLSYDNVFLNLNSLARAAGQGGVYDPFMFNIKEYKGCSVTGYRNGKLDLEGIEPGANAAMNYTLNHDGEIYLCLRSMEQARLDVYINGELHIANARCDGPIYIGSLKKDDSISVNIIPAQGVAATSAVLHGAMLNTRNLAGLYDLLADEQLAITYYDENTVNGIINVKEDSGILFLSVPESPGWSISVDGKKVQPGSIFNAYMYLTLCSGRHEITLEYKTPGFNEGVLISAASLLAFTCVWLYEAGILKKRGKSERE